MFMKIYPNKVKMMEQMAEKFYNRQIYHLRWVNCHQMLFPSIDHQVHIKISQTKSLTRVFFYHVMHNKITSYLHSHPLFLFQTQVCRLLIKIPTVGAPMARRWLLRLWHLCCWYNARIFLFLFLGLHAPLCTIFTRFSSPRR